jgi:peptidyl-prolyl cis-trans isomerase D
MLQSMRQLAHTWVVKGLMLFLAVSFSIWGIGDIFRGNTLQKSVAKVGGVSISVQELNHLFEETLAQARQKVDPNLTAQQARNMGLLDKTLDNEIKRKLVDMDIKRQGINVGPDAILKVLAAQPQFRMKDGSFNKALFRQLLEQQRLSEASFLAQSQQDLSRQVLLDALSGSHVVPQVMSDTLYKARAQKRVLDVVTVDASKIGGIPAPDDKALHDFYDQNAKLFEAPEYRSITVASLSAETVDADISISDDQVKKEYDAKLDQLAQPEQRNVLQVVVQDEEKAKQLSKQAETSGNLASTAKESKETAIPLDQLEEKNLMPELSKVVFAMHEGEVSSPIKTQLGWHVVQLKKIQPAGTPSFAEVKDKLRDDMRRDQSVEAVTRTVNQLDDQLAAGHSLDDIADGLKMRLVKIPAVDIAGLLPDGKAPAELPNKDAVLKDAFTQNAGETSPVEDDKSGNYFVVRTDDITPSGVRPFDTVKNKVAEAWKAHEQMAKAQAEAKKIAASLREGKAPSSFDGDEGVSSRTSLPLSLLGDADNTLPPELVTQAFKLKKGETATAASGSKQVVARLASVIDADTAKPDTRKNIVTGEIARTESTELLDQYMQHLYTVFPVTKNAALLDQLRQKEE